MIYLFSFRIIIHGALDEYSRLIQYISLENNNCSETAFDLFKKGDEKPGFLASVRYHFVLCNIKKFTQNSFVDLEVWLWRWKFIDGRVFKSSRRIELGKSNKSSKTDESVHNQKIECLWKDAIERCTVTFMDFFAWVVAALFEQNFPVLMLNI